MTPSTTASKVEPVVESKTHSTESREATGTSKVPASGRGSHTHRVGAGGEEESFSFPYPPLPLRPKEDLGCGGGGAVLDRRKEALRALRVLSEAPLGPRGSQGFWK